MQPTPDQQDLIDDYGDLLGGALNLAWGRVEAPGDDSDLVQAVGAYLDRSEELESILADSFDPDLDDPASAQSRLAWTVVGDLLVLSAIGAVDSAVHQGEDDVRYRLQVLAKDELMPRQAAEAIDRGEFQPALIDFARSTYEERMQVIAGVKGLAEISGGAHSNPRLQDAASEVIEGILDETTDTIGKLLLTEVAVGLASVDLSRVIDWATPGVRDAVGELPRGFEVQLADV